MLSKGEKSVYTALYLNKTGMHVREICRYAKLTIPAVTNIKEKNIPNIKLPCVSIEFNFTSKYTSEEKTFAEISIIGEIIYTGNDNGEILKKWKESKELLQTQYTSIINTIFKRCAIKALQLTEDLQLPPLIGFPFVDNKKRITISYFYNH